MWVKDKSPWNPQNDTQKKTEQSVALALFLPPLILTLISPSCPPPVSPPHPISYSQHFRCLVGLHDMSADVMDGNCMDWWLTHAHMLLSSKDVEKMMMTMQIFTKTENKKGKDTSAHIWCGGGHRAGAREGHKLVTSFVDHKTAN